MGHVTRFTPHAQRDMLKIPRADALRILYRLTELQSALDEGATAGFDIKALHGHAERWRLRVGDYRVVYTIEEGRLIIWVLVAAHRREAYPGCDAPTHGSGGAACWAGNRLV